MAIEVAVVRATSPASATTVDFTSTGFGTPTAAIFFMSNGDTDGTAVADDLFYSIGFTNGTNHRSIAVASLDPGATMDTSRNFSTTNLVMRIATLAGAATETGVFNSWITDGVRLDWASSASFLELKIVCVLIKGVSADVGTFTPNATQNSTASITGLAYEPDLAFFITNGDTAAGASTQNIVSFGAAYNGASIQQRAFMFYDEDNVADADVGSRLETDSIGGQYFNGVVTWTGEVTAFNSDGLTITTRDGGSASDIMGYLTLSPLGVDASIQTIDSPTSATTKKYSTTFQTDSVIAVMSRIVTANTSEQTDVFSMGAASNGAGEFSVGGGSLDAVASADTYNVTDSKIVSTQEGAGASVWAADNVAAVSSYDSDGITFNYTTADGTARLGWALIIGSAGAAPTQGTLGIMTTRTGWWGDL